MNKGKENNLLLKPLQLLRRFRLQCTKKILRYQVNTSQGQWTNPHIIERQMSSIEECVTPSILTLLLASGQSVDIILDFFQRHGTLFFTGVLEYPVKWDIRLGIFGLPRFSLGFVIGLTALYVEAEDKTLISCLDCSKWDMIGLIFRWDFDVYNLGVDYDTSIWKTDETYAAEEWQGLLPSVGMNHVVENFRHFQTFAQIVGEHQQERPKTHCLHRQSPVRRQIEMVILCSRCLRLLLR